MAANCITSEKIRDISIVHFCFNEINLDQKEHIQETLNGLLQAGETKFVIDLSRIGFLSSLVMSVIVFFSKEVRKNNGDIKICGMSSEAYSVFQITQLDKIFELYKSVDDAIESFEKT